MTASTAGVFCDGTRRNAVQEILSQKDASRDGVPEPFFKIKIALLHSMWNI
jgi:hypothetical protein